MPDLAVHAAFGREVFTSLDREIRDVLPEQPYTFGLFGPDLWFTFQAWKPRREGRGRRMHTTLTGRFLTALAVRAKGASCRKDLFAYLAGFLCHYALDTTTHPYIIYRTTEEFHFPRCHMSFEHGLDLKEMERAGCLGGKHPVTENYFPRLRLPETMRADLNAVFEDVYGWKRCFSSLNRCCARYRLCYRVTENPKGLLSRLARRTGNDLLRSLVYSESQFADADVENLARAPWKHSHESTLAYTDTFPEMRERARALAVRLITAAYRFVFLGEGTEAELAARIGSNSYLSGLPVDDPRNHNVESLLPPAAGREQP